MERLQDKFKEVKQCLRDAYDEAWEEVVWDENDIASLRLMEQIEYAIEVLDADSRSDNVATD